MNSKSLEADSAEEHRLLRGGGGGGAAGTGCSAGPWATNVHRAAARTPLIAVFLRDRPVQAVILGEGAKRLFFSDGAQGRSMGQRLSFKYVKHSAAGNGSSCAFKRGYCMSTSSARTSGALWGRSRRWHSSVADGLPFSCAPIFFLKAEITKSALCIAYKQGRTPLLSSAGQSVAVLLPE